MNPRNLLLTVAAVIVLGATFTLRSQGLTDGIKVTLPEPVTVGDVVLDPGEYEIRRASSVTDQVLRIFSNDKLRYQTNVLTIPALDKDTPEETKVILHHIGDKYYFDKIWMQGKDYGYEFVLPDKVRALQKELAVSVAAKYQPTEATAEPTSVERSEAITVPESSTQSVSAAEQDRERAAARDRELQEARDRDANEHQEQLERDRVAALQREPAPAAQNPADARQDRPAAGIQDNARTQDNATAQGNNQQNPDQLPATASDWLSYVVSGCLLLGMAAFFRKPRTQE
jgi:hypothetical protein